MLIIPLTFVVIVTRTFILNGKPAPMVRRVWDAPTVMIRMATSSRWAQPPRFAQPVIEAFHKVTVIHSTICRV